MNDFQARLKELREEKGLLQKDLAAIIAKSVDTVSAYETERAEPSIDTLIKLADCFQTSIDYLVGRADDFGGVQIHNELDDDEKCVIKGYKQLSPYRKGKLAGYLDSLLQAEKEEKRNI